MDNPSQPPRPAHLLDDLESIRALLDEHTSSEPPLLTESVDPASIPLLSEIVEPPPFSPTPAPQAAQPATPAAPRPAPAPTPVPVKAAAPVPPVAPAPAAPSSAQPSVRAGVEAAAQTQLDRLDGELRAAAQLILQDVIDDFVPQIEAELKRRLNARLARLLPQLPRRS